MFPENVNDLIPIVDVAGLSLLGANQLFRIQYLNHTFTDNFSWQRGNHSFKFGGLATLRAEERERGQPSARAGFAFVGHHRRSDRVPELPARQRRRPVPACTYTEAERDIDLQLRFNRFEFYAQDTWRPRVGPHGRLRRSLLAVSADDRREQPAGDVRSVAYNAAAAPPFANAAGTLIDRTRGDLLVGIIQGGVNSPYGDGIYEFKKNSDPAAHRRGVGSVG